MKLATLLSLIESQGGAATEADLAARMGTTVSDVRAMLAALRAAGRLGPDGGHEPGTTECASSGSCAVSCTGPSDCPFVVDIGPTLEIRRRPAASVNLRIGPQSTAE